MVLTIKELIGQGELQIERSEANKSHWVNLYHNNKPLGVIQIRVSLYHSKIPVNVEKPSVKVHKAIRSLLIILARTPKCYFHQSARNKKALVPSCRSFC